MKTLKRIFFDESGSPALEYALLLGLVGLAIVASMQNLRGALETMMTKASGEVDKVRDSFGSGGN
jgi:Flp pilus assembly pilin Flp